MEKSTKNLPRIHRHTLVEINRSVFSGRCHAAHEKLLELLQKEIYYIPKKERGNIYEFSIMLLNDCLTTTKRSQIQKASILLHYFQLMLETVSAAYAIYKHEQRILDDEKEFSQILDEKMQNKLKDTYAIFSASEKNIITSIDNLIDFGIPIVENDKEEKKAIFSVDDTRRYNLALNEYRRIYSELYDA